ncbi:cyclopropane fatty acyl phospholipid synthase [Candidatus Hamiltonella defensa]|uniref:cyclopropane fatty acyl phospholipid synthase n=1 Tax=Candidatus Williamhamiltonella defendens TaxID=138072 RepID=UPI0015833312|nr:cyclopropane fatty acyl phospholipid synthase [Candidatus Hamiltonella defensa]
MSVSCVKNLSFQDNSWYHIVDKLLAYADIEINGLRPFDIHVNNPDLFKRVLQYGSLGLGESYMDGWWECEQLDIFFQRVLRAGLKNKIPQNFKDILRVIVARVTNFQSRKRAWIVGKEHYDIGNDLFSLMLDPFMQYSCGYWHHATNLEQAQKNKLEMICQKLQLRPGISLLDVGCGWGGLAHYAAKYHGAKVHGITISAEQQKFAQKHCEGQDINILLQDYRDLNLQFDRIVSVGMFEHVGQKNYHTYFDVIARNLKPDGLFLLQTIGTQKTDMNFDPWIDKYIFPNGRLPSVQNIAKASERYFVMEDWHNFGADYDLTLMAWHERFVRSWPSLQNNYSDRFYRMFVYYLHSCAGAFRSRRIQLWQVLFSPHGVEGTLCIAR